MLDAAHRRDATDPDNILHMDPNVETAQVESLGLDWADKDAAASALEETRKTLRAQLILEHQKAARDTGNKTPAMNQLESLAEGDTHYEGHINLMVAARREANRAKVSYDIAKERLTLLRSLLYTRRDQMRLGGIPT